MPIPVNMSSNGLGIPVRITGGGLLPAGGLVLLPDGQEVPRGWRSTGTITVGDATYQLISQGTTPAPTVVSGPTANPAVVTVGDNVTFTDGTYTNSTSVQRQLLQGGVDRTSEVNDNIWSPGVAGVAVWTVTPVGPGGTGEPQTFNVTVNEAAQPLGPSDFYMFANHTDAPQATGADILSLQSRGTAAPLFTIIGNSTTPTPIKEADAIRMRNGRYLVADISSIPSGDGFILAAEFTVRSVAGTNQLISIALTNTQGAALRTSGTTIQPYIGHLANGTAENLSAGTTAIGQRIKMLMEVDRVAGRVRYWNVGTQAVVSRALTVNNVLTTNRIVLGQNSDASIHDLRVIVRAEGQPWPTTFEELLADFL